MWSASSGWASSAANVAVAATLQAPVFPAEGDIFQTLSTLYQRECADRSLSSMMLPVAEHVFASSPVAGHEEMSSPASLRWSLVGEAFRGSSNGRFDAMLDCDNFTSMPDVVEAMRELGAAQHEVGLRRVPLLAVWGVDAATPAQLEELTAVTAAFLETVR